MRTAIISLAVIVPLSLLPAACATEKHACDAKGHCAGDAACDKGGGGKRGCEMHGGGMHGDGMHAAADGAACPMMGAASPTALPEGVNAAQNEMRLLNHAFHMSVTAAALGDVSVIPGLFHPVHQARELTDKALAEGAWKPARGDLAAFKAMDEAFHGELEKLVRAAEANDVTAVAEQLDHLLPSCMACHAAHREPGLPAGMKPTPAEHAEHPAGAEHPKR